MTEVPEYLLERSRQRRAALGLPGGEAPASDGGASAAPAAPATGVATADTPPAGPQPSAATTATAVITEPVPAVQQIDTGPRSGIPVWMMPVLLILPFWAMVYMGAFAEPEAAAGPRTGAQIYVSAGCGSCHGPTGGGGVGPRLAGSETKLTFPDVEDMITWVAEGSAPKRGESYGDPNRPGGPRPPASGGMPAFKGQLTPEEITTVVEYIREEL